MTQTFFYRKMSRVNLGGSLSFDRRGDREQADYTLINVHRVACNPGPCKSSRLVEVGRFRVRSFEQKSGKTILDPRTEKELYVNMSKVYWPPGNFQRKTTSKECVEVSKSECRRQEEKVVYLAPISYKQRTLLRVSDHFYLRLICACDTCICE